MATRQVAAIATGLRPAAAALVLLLATFTGCQSKDDTVSRTAGENVTRSAETQPQTITVASPSAQPAKPEAVAGMCDLHRDLIDYAEQRISDAEAELSKWRALRAWFRYASRSCCDRRGT